MAFTRSPKQVLVGLAYTTPGLVLWVMLFAVLDFGTALPGDLSAFLSLPTVIPFLVYGSILYDWYIDREAWLAETSLPPRIGLGVLVAVASGVVTVPVALGVDAVLPVFVALFVGILVATLVGMVVTVRLLADYVDIDAMREQSRWAS